MPDSGDFPVQKALPCLKPLYYLALLSCAFEKVIPCYNTSSRAGKKKRSLSPQGGSSAVSAKSMRAMANCHAPCTNTRTALRSSS